MVCSFIVSLHFYMRGVFNIAHLDGLNPSQGDHLFHIESYPSSNSTLSTISGLPVGHSIMHFPQESPLLMTMTSKAYAVCIRTLFACFVTVRPVPASYPILTMIENVRINYCRFPELPA
jgi:hypothetical protein